jgi:FkbM family methyltransferase
LKLTDYERLIRRTANRLGIDIHRYRPAETLPGLLALMLRHHEVDVLLDVGANIGQFAKSIREAGFRRRLVSFEPLQDAHAELVAESRNDPEWLVADRLAIGAEEGEVVMNVAGNSFSSSVLDMLPAHENAAPESTRVATERARLAPLDVAAREYVQGGDSVFIKIDTQGYEGHVLRGATGILEQTAGLHVELSFVPLYEGQPLFHEMVERICDEGFRIWGIWSGIHDPGSGRMLQVDATFFREEVVGSNGDPE